MRGDVQGAWWATLLIGVILIVIAIFQPHVSVLLLLIGIIVVGLAALGLLGDDVLGDHPDEPREGQG